MAGTVSQKFKSFLKKNTFKLNNGKEISSIKNETNRIFM